MSDWSIYEPNGVEELTLLCYDDKRLDIVVLTNGRTDRAFG
ncbi:hypothetical protein HMPREF0080_01922 [Anaeroglobus geminatus F0357]|uniref:Uncharacterized protein n=1 Tax=Anaeroglobus geminatus F0357 TaxID=861450 RepID=G9YJR8_9FIRM|nr:hypothetical protein HMPREF0080_01922 [Anaeroglobus geminatus F0357]